MEFLNYIDKIKLPFELPLLLHPITVHFLVAIPIVILLLELANLALKRPYLDKITAIFWFVLIFMFVFAFFAGKTDGSHAFSLLSEDGQKELKFHKTLGMYIVYASILPFIFKLIAIGIKKRAATIIYLVIVLAFIGAILKQGRDGGELVYEYGANVEAVSKYDDKVMDLEDKIDELKEKAQNCESKLKELQSQKPAQTAIHKEENSASTIEEQNQSNESSTLAPSTSEEKSQSEVNSTKE